MRIVGGTWRGRPIEAPTGRGTTRPTTDRMRESIASMVLSAFGLDLSGVSVLDAFAGSGALGLEMLSRGARRCTFVESEGAPYACLRSNVRSLCLDRGRAAVLKADALRLPARASVPGAPFGLVLLDPPYAMDATVIAGLVSGLREVGMLEGSAVILYERSREAGMLQLGGSRLISSREHGITAVDLMRVDADIPDSVS